MGTRMEYWGSLGVRGAAAAEVGPLFITELGLSSRVPCLEGIEDGARVVVLRAGSRWMALPDCICSGSFPSTTACWEGTLRIPRCLIRVTRCQQFGLKHEPSFYSLPAFIQIFSFLENALSTKPPTLGVRAAVDLP